MDEDTITSNMVRRLSSRTRKVATQMVAALASSGNRTQGALARLEALENYYPGAEMIEIYSDDDASLGGEDQDVEEAFDVLYCIAFAMMDAQWLVMRDSYMEFIDRSLNHVLPKKESYIKELQTNLGARKEINCHQHSELKVLNEKRNNEARRMKSLEREGDRIRSQISLFKSKVKTPLGTLVDIGSI